jgi:hypothetical protein
VTGLPELSYTPIREKVTGNPSLPVTQAADLRKSLPTILHPPSIHALGGPDNGRFPLAPPQGPVTASPAARDSGLGEGRARPGAPWACSTDSSGPPVAAELGGSLDVETPPLVDLLTGDVARAVLAALLRDQTARVRRDGLTLPSWLEPVCRALAAVADREPPPLPRSAIGRAVGTVESWVSVAEAADLTGHSERHIRRLAQSRQVLAQRVGRRSWLVDADSVRHVLRRTA